MSISPNPMMLNSVPLKMGPKPRQSSRASSRRTGGSSPVVLGGGAGGAGLVGGKGTNEVSDVVAHQGDLWLSH
jgi:hypothetical protein